MANVVKSLKESKSACWLAWACLVVPMFASYFFDDMFSTISHIFQDPEKLALGWNAMDYGVYAGGYSFLCVWGGLIVCGILLDKWGVRITGSIFVGLMTLGAALVYVTISTPAIVASGHSLKIAYVGCMLFGLGSEIAGVAVTRSIAKWFKGKSMALAMGLQLAIARLGTAAALLLSPVLVAQSEAGYPLNITNRPALVGLCLLLVGSIVWAVFVAMDAKFDKQTGTTDKVETAEEDKFKFSDIFRVLANKHFILISLLCVFFYCCIISFKKFATAILIPRFGAENAAAFEQTAAQMVSMIPFFTVVFTPLFGILVDKLGKATTWMVTGSILVFLAHIIIAFAPGEPIYGYIGIAILGVGYSLVPAAMWPSVPKIIPEKNLGTAYSLIYWIQNMGMLAVPIGVGYILKNFTGVEASVYAEYIFIGLGIVAITVSLLLFVSSKKNPQLKLDVPNIKK
ncbi:MAG: MFS transporter [Bacteroidales bacterium]|jgi:MFS family permease|nr:MFS transporter [Bacteroidales bacterium]